MIIAPRRILITGASGFVGRHLTRALARAFPDCSLLTPTMDVRDDAAVETVVHDALPDVCVHLAAVSTIAAAHRDEDHAWQVNLKGSLRLARAILRYVPKCQMLFVSSAEAYGTSFRSGTQIDENAPLAPMNVYSATKAAADLALGSMAIQHNLRLVRLRPFNHTGVGQSPHFVVAAFARQIARIAFGLQEPLLWVGNLDTWRDFLDVRDVCAAYVACISRRDSLPSGTILNLASGETRRIGDVLAQLQSLAGIELELCVDPSRVRSTELRVACGSPARAATLLSWKPTVSWTQTLQDVLDDWRGRAASEAEGP
jgi:GDP-4-dehydro-6-deoxy-D-mannose reductase